MYRAIAIVRGALGRLPKWQAVSGNCLDRQEKVARQKEERKTQDSWSHGLKSSIAPGHKACIKLLP
jgi:hypothetical protein